MEAIESAYLSPGQRGALGGAQAVRCEGTLYINGAAGINDDGLVCSNVGIESQLIQAYQNLIRLLAEFGARPESVVAETIYVTDLDRAISCGVAERTYSGLVGPTRAWLEVRRLILPDLMVQISCVARI